MLDGFEILLEKEQVGSISESEDSEERNLVSQAPTQIFAELAN